MAKLKLSRNVTLLVTIAALMAISCALDCSHVVVKESEGVLNWLGNITFTVPVTTTPEVGWDMRIQFDQNFTGVGAWSVWVETHVEQKYAIFRNRKENAQINAGDEYSFRFRVNYPSRDTPQPQVVSLRFLDIELCLPLV